MIEIKNVSFSYSQGGKGNELRDINLTIRDGEVILLCGESGCGKTTLTRLINGLIPHYYGGNLTGEIFVDGKEIHKMPLYETAKLVGSVFQNPRSQFFNVDTTSELAFGGENMGLAVETIEERIKNTVCELNLEKLMNRSLFRLSGGEKQKIACASVSVMEPEIFVLDEPSSNLDITSIKDIKQVLKQWKQKGKTIIIAEHRLYFMMELVDRILYMQDGKIISDMTVNEFRQIASKKSKYAGLRSLYPAVFNESLPSCDLSEEIKLYNFSFSYGKHVAMNIPSLTVPRGAIIGVLGNNGAGKTTFARSLCGLERKSKGELLFDDKPYNTKQRIQLCYMVMQDVNHQIFTESVLDEILLSMHGKDEEEKEAAAEKILAGLNLLEYKERHPMSLSGGQKQRVAIGSAIASGKEIIVFDEPTSGLDHRHMLEVANNLRMLSEMGKTLFVITHDPELIAETCNYFIFIQGGEVAWGQPFNAESKTCICNFFADAV